MSERTCSTDGCEAAVQVREWCKKHYMALYFKDRSFAKRQPTRDASIRRGPYGGCWEWTGAKGDYGHGLHNRSRVHRLVYEAIYGPIPSGLEVCHHCDNPPCFRPDHLFLGSHADNMADMARKGRSRGPRRPWKKRLTPDSVRAIRAASAAGASRNALGREYGVSAGCIRLVVTRQTWRHVA